MNKQYDLCVIGGGPGGYVASIKAAQSSMKVALIEKRPGGELGGTCLNVGCIPSKALLHSAHKWHELSKLQEHGINLNNPSLDWSKLLLRKDKIISKQRSGLKYLIKKHNIDYYYGHGKFDYSDNDKDLTTISIDQNTKYKDKNVTEKISAKYVIIATGSKVRHIPQVKVDGEFIHDSDTLFNLSKLPKSIMILGAGVIGMEWASLFSMLGVKVTVLDAAKQVLLGFDRDCVNHLLKQLDHLDVDILTNAKVLEVTISNSDSKEKEHDQTNCLVTYQHNQQTLQLSVDLVLSAIGRVPNTQSLELDQLGIELLPGDFIKINKYYQTSKQNIYAIGDVLSTPALAHTASKEAEIVVEHITKKQNITPFDYNCNPMALYTYPQIAYIGPSSKQLDGEGVKYGQVKFPLSIIAKSQIVGEQGFIKLIFDHITKEILAVHIVADHATEMISEFALAKKLECTLEEFCQVVRPHPTISECLTEVALLALDHPLHF